MITGITRPRAKRPRRGDLRHVGWRQWASGEAAWFLGIYWGYHGDNFFRTAELDELDAEGCVWKWGKKVRLAMVLMAICFWGRIHKYHEISPWTLYSNTQVGQNMTGWCSKPPWGPQHDLCNELLASSDLWMDLLKSHMFYGKSTAKQFFEWNTRWKPIFSSCNLWFCPVKFHWNQSQSNPMIERHTKSESVDVCWDQLQRRFLPFNWLLGSSDLPRHQQEQWQYPPGWWYTYPSENMSSSLGMIIPNIWKNKKMFQTTNQPLIDVGVQLWSWTSSSKDSPLNFGAKMGTSHGRRGSGCANKALKCFFRGTKNMIICQYMQYRFGFCPWSCLKFRNVCLRRWNHQIF